MNSAEKVPRNTYTVDNLLEETDYEFRVSAENQAGLGPPSTASRSAKFGEFSLHLHEIPDIPTFKGKLKMHLFRQNCGP